MSHVSDFSGENFVGYAITPFSPYSKIYSNFGRNCETFVKGFFSHLPKFEFCVTLKRIDRNLISKSKSGCT